MDAARGANPPGSVKTPAIVVGRRVLQDREVTRATPSEGSDCQVGLAVAVEVGGLDVGDARPSGHVTRRVGAVALTAEPHDGTLVMIAGLELTEVADKEIHRPRRDRGRTARCARDSPAARSR